MAPTDMKAPQAPETIKIGTRASKLAIKQAELVAAQLRRAFPRSDVQIVPMSTGGDLNKLSPLYLLGGSDKGLWTKELEDGLLNRSVDLIVHSLKDVPTALPEGCELSAVSARADPRDALVVKKGLPYKSLEDLPDRSVVGTSSVRRVAQLRRAFPSFRFSDIRGNIDTRLDKLDAPESEYAAIILAAAGLDRMDKSDRISAYPSADVLLHAVGQGALGIETRLDDDQMRAVVRFACNDWRTELACSAERSMLRVLQGGCSAPLGAHTQLEVSDEHAQTGTLTLTGSLTSIGGTEHVQHALSAQVRSVEDAVQLGADVARYIVAHGGQPILDAVNSLRHAKEAQDIVKVHDHVKDGANILDCPAVSAASTKGWVEGHPNIPEGMSAMDCPAVQQKMHELHPQ